jgi:plasmid stabilization system protein ParE
MVEKIIWSPLAVETYNEIAEYLLYKFGESSVQKFFALVDERLQLICTRPRMFRPTHKRKNTYTTAINKKLTLIYRYQPRKKQIELVVFWGMQDPERKPD